MEHVTPNEVNASGDFIRNLKLGAEVPKAPAPVMRQGAGDRLADFFHVLKGAEGTLRNWRTRTSPDRMTYLAALEKPVRTKTQTVEEFKDAEKFWRTTLLGILFMELAEPGGDPIVAQGALDALRGEKVGRR